MSFRSCIQHLVVIGLALAGALAPVRAGDADFFERRIRPVLAEHCYECHSETSRKLKGGLKLDSREQVRRGGDHGPVLIPGDPNQSRLITALRYSDHDLQMPPKGRLPQNVIADFERWIREGAEDPREAVRPASASPGSASPAAPNPATHWAFQPLRPILPPIPPEGTRDLRSPIDAFIAKSLADAGLAPAPPADRRTWIRRLSFDLTGLPPDAESVQAFERDPAPDADERLVERLLASPQYGERWARWWLDLARYADTNGQDENKVMANAWRYRDWVIRAFNANLPFDQFAIQQLAGDLLPTRGLDEAAVFDRWIATGLLVMGPKMLAEQDKPKLVMDLVDEQIDVVTRAFLGLTVGCARCHDHKYDPIPTRDYYALAGIFKSTRAMENLDFVSKFNERPISTREHLAAIDAHARELADASQALDSALREAGDALQSQWEQQFPSLLATALPSAAGASPGSGTPASDPSDRRGQLQGLIAADPSTNRPSRLLREWAQGGQSAADLQQLKSDRAGFSGLRLGPGRVGAAFVGSGTNSLDLPHAPELEPARLTLETWVRAAAFPADGDARRWLLNKNANEWVEGHYALVLDRDRPGVYLNIGGGKENLFALWSDGPRLKAHQWHHLAFTYDGTLLRLFVDGKAAGELAIERPRRAGPGRVALGRREDGYIHFKGSLDEARVYSRALGPAEIQNRFEHPESPADTGVVARWEFNELSPAEERTLARAELAEALWGVGGLFALPADPRPLFPESTRQRIADLEARRKALQQAAPPPKAFALAVSDDKPVDLPVHVRGNHLSPTGNPVPRGFLSVAHREAAPGIPDPSSGRLELARWITSPENPLTARVVVNRVWQAHFGEGLVRSPDNFGLRGEKPTHPELLDWLAMDFIQSGWDLKHLHRQIVLSRTYRQGQAPRTASPSDTTDPENRWLSHFPRQRLEAEMVRDALLRVSGRLDSTLGGSLVAWKNNEYVPADDVSEGSLRRSVYLPIVRDRVYDVFTLFDFANPSVGTARRTPTVVSHQALFFLNSPLVKSTARAMAQSLVDAPADDSARLESLYRSCFGRAPTLQESARSLQFLERQSGDSSPSKRLASWSALCQTLLASNEFLYRD